MQNQKNFNGGAYYSGSTLHRPKSCLFLTSLADNTKVSDVTLDNDKIKLNQMLQKVSANAQGTTGVERVADLVRQVDSAGHILGIKLFYGDTKVTSEEEAQEEGKVQQIIGGENPPKISVDKSDLKCARDLLYNVLLGLCTIQHNGNMVIKVHEMHDIVSVGIIFTLYNLFQRVCLVKPYATSFLSGRQYLICTGLKQRRPQAAIS